MQADHTPAVRQLLGEARHALESSNPQHALQCVVQALKLLHGDNAVLPALRLAAEQFHSAQQHRAEGGSNNIDELAQLLAQVSLAAEQQQRQQQQQQQGTTQTQQHQQQQHQAEPMQMQPHEALYHQQQHRPHEPSPQQFQHPSWSNKPILQETGREDFTDAALADGSSWQCPHCSGVVPLNRQHAHLTHWCPSLHASSSSS